MAKLVLTVVGDDRAGLVEAVADVVSAHGGNWETSELAELAGAFAGIVLVSVPDARVDELSAALSSLDGMLRITLHTGDPAPRSGEERRLAFTVLGNDHPGIVRDVSGALSRHGLTIDQFSSHTVDAPMSGGTLFEAHIAARALPGADIDAVTADLERLAGEIQVELAVADR
jgi:glycine cleavage system regulatory protein